MKNTKQIITFIILFVLSNILTTSWYMITSDVNTVSFQREEANYLGLVFNHLIFVAGLIYLLNGLIKIESSRLQAFTYGVVIAGIMFIPTGLVVRSIWLVNFDKIFIYNSIAHLIIGGILGVVFHFIYMFERKAN
ncbi:MAG: hypothetical protein HRT61_19385 [Ekhidna sp.]|nr:hypothetical protein [Ekhidna sp.]